MTKAAAFVLGLGENGYGIVRGLASQGIRVLGSYSERREFGRFSRYCAARPLPSFLGESEHICRRLIQWAQDAKGRPVLFPTADSFAWVLARHQEELAEYFRFHWVSESLLERVVDKAQMGVACEQAGVRIPWTHVTRAGENLAERAREFHFPCVVKPNRSFNTPFPATLKNFVAATPEELLGFYERHPGLQGATLWQEVIEGGDENIFQCTALIRESGAAAAAFTARKLHQCPPGYGVMCFGRSESNPELVEATLRLLERLNYRGLASLEFKYRPSDGRYYFIEMNPRLPWYNGLFLDAGVNLPYLAYLDLTEGAEGAAAVVNTRQRDGVHWVSLEGELLWVSRTRKTRGVNLLSWLGGLARARSHGWMNWRDPEPFLRSLLALGRLSVRRAVRISQLYLRSAGGEFEGVLRGWRGKAASSAGKPVVTGGPSGASRPALRVKEFESWEEMEHLRPTWNEFAAQSSSSSIFLTWDWLRSWWSAYGGARELAILAWFDGGKEIVALAPFYHASRRVGGVGSLRELRFVGDGSGDSDNLDLLVRPGYEGAVAASLLEWLGGQGSRWDVLRLNTMPAESPASGALREALGERGWARWEKESPHGLVALPGDWESYLQSLSRNARYQVRSRLRRLESRGDVRLRRCRTAEELPEFLEALCELHRKRWVRRGEPGTLHVPQRRRFYAEMTRRALAQGWLDFWLLELGGHAAAAHLGFRYRDTHTFLQSGFDPACAEHSVGFALTALLMRELVGDGVRWYDFLAGEEPHKRRWRGEWRSYTHVACARPRSQGALYLGVARSLTESKARLRRQVPASVWAAANSVYHFLSWRKRWTPEEQWLTEMEAPAGFFW